MKKYIKYILLFLLFVFVYSFNKPGVNKSVTPFTFQQIALDGNNINSWISNTGVFDQNFQYSNAPGFEWPKDSGSFAIFSSGLTVAAVINDSLRMSSASYRGEYETGHIILISGIPTAVTDPSFHMYKVKKSDSWQNNSDWLNWGLMVPYGAPFTDVNHNGVYDPTIDTPGVKFAEQTIFVCLTDGFSSSHQSGEGFGGGTFPMFNEIHLTAWCYNVPFLNDVQFLKWDIINKNIYSWGKTYISIVSEPDLGCPNDDYTGCDTLRQLFYCYNGESIDCNYSTQYHGVPPAVGFQWLNCSSVSNLGIKSFIKFKSINDPGPQCESDALGEPVSAYLFMKGVKKDSTNFVIPPGGNMSYVTKFIYSGDPETGTGWCEGNGNPTGSIWNCGGPNVYSGTYHQINLFGTRRIVISTGSDINSINPGDTERVMIAQLIARGTSYLNSVTKLKILSDTVKAFCSRGFVIGMQPISSTIAQRFELYQNYPNPFNPTTKIKFSIPEVRGLMSEVRLVIYDVLGREVVTLVNEKLSTGTYEVEFDGTNYPSGVYFYKLSTNDFVQSRKMVLVK